MVTRTTSLARARKPRQGTEILCERVFRPLAHLLVLALLPLRVPPPAVVAVGAATGLVAAAELGRGGLLAAALLLQLKTVLDNADGQLARLSGRVTAFGRYLDSESDLLVDAAVFAALGPTVGPWLALAGFLALTFVLSVNFNVERLYRRERGGAAAAMPEAPGRPAAALARLYAVVYHPQDRLFEAFVERRLRGAGPAARLAYHDPATVGIVANLGLSTQLAALGLCLAAGHPAAFVWLVLAELPLLGVLAARREVLVRRRRDTSPVGVAVPTID